jgi:hypothetical protein
MLRPFSCPYSPNLLEEAFSEVQDRGYSVLERLLAGGGTMGAWAYREEDAVAEYRNELLDGLVGRPVMASHLKAPPLEDEHVAKLVADPTFGRAELLQSRRGSYELVRYDGVGVTLRLLMPGEPPFFVPWGAVIEIYQGLEEHEALTR